MALPFMVKHILLRVQFMESLHSPTNISCLMVIKSFVRRNQNPPRSCHNLILCSFLYSASSLLSVRYEVFWFNITCLRSLESSDSFHICSVLFCLRVGKGCVEDKRVIVETTSMEKHLLYHNYHLPTLCLQPQVFFSLAHCYKLLSKWSRQ